LSAGSYSAWQTPGHFGADTRMFIRDRGRRVTARITGRQEADPLLKESTKKLIKSCTYNNFPQDQRNTRRISPPPISSSSAPITLSSVSREALS
jgi:hypothetical protein